VKNNDDASGPRPVAAARRKLDLTNQISHDQHLGMKFTMDNLNKVLRPNEYSSRNQTATLNVVSAAVILNRIPSLKADFCNIPILSKAADLDWSTFLPTSDELKKVRGHRLVLIKRILVKGLAIFERLEDEVEWHIPHKYSDQSLLKSETVK